MKPFDKRVYATYPSSVVVALRQELDVIYE